MYAARHKVPETVLLTEEFWIAKQSLVSREAHNWVLSLRPASLGVMEDVWQRLFYSSTRFRVVLIEVKGEYATVLSFPESTEILDYANGAIDKDALDLVLRKFAVRDTS